jgi:hypothetical protein
VLFFRVKKIEDIAAFYFSRSRMETTLADRSCGYGYGAPRLEENLCQLHTEY